MATKWGIVSAGKISHDFVTAVRSAPGEDHKFVAVAARALDSAREFASLHNISKAYGSYKELAMDPDIEVVYVGTITSQHFPVGKLLLEHGKHVLMEKPMTVNSIETKALIELARKHKRFLMEAVWSRFSPSYKRLMELLKSKSVGEVLHVSANIGVPLVNFKSVDKSVGSGSVLDVGIYALNAVNMVYGGEKPKKVSAVGHVNENGADIAVVGSLLYSEKRTAQVAISALADLPCDLVIIGTKGCIKVPENIWCPTRILTAHETIELPLPDTILPCHFVNSSGLRYEAEEVRKCLLKGGLESSIMPLKDSEDLAEMMEEILRQIGVTY